MPVKGARRSGWHRLAVALTAGIALAGLWLLLLAASIVSYAGESDGDSADVALVLGAAVANDVPTPVFEQRLLHAINLYQTGRVKRLMLTGGVGAGDVLAESEAAQLYCLTRGVAAQDILIETTSRSTLENLVNARQVLADAGPPSPRVLLVSDPLHLRRAITEARDLGLDAYPSPTPTSRYTGWESRSRFVLRELYFYTRYLVHRTVPWVPGHRGR